MNSVTEESGAESDSKLLLTQFSAASLNGGDLFPWAKKDGGGADGFPWSIVKTAAENGDLLATEEVVLQRTIGSLIGMYVRVHRISDPVTEDFRPNRVNFVVADDKPNLVQVYIG